VSLPPPRPRKLQKPNRVPRRSNSSKKTAQARREIRKFKARAQQFSHNGRSQSNKTKFPQAHQKIVPAVAETKTKKLGKPNKKLRNPTKPTKKIKRANSNGHFLCRHRANKKWHTKAQRKTPKAELQQKAAQKKPKATGELGIFARAKRRIVNARIQFNEGHEPFATAKNKKAQKAIPMVNSLRK
jgi:hypothetical protein